MRILYVKLPSAYTELAMHVMAQSDNSFISKTGDLCYSFRLALAVFEGHWIIGIEHFLIEQKSTNDLRKTNQE